MADIGELNLKIRVNADTGQLQIFNDEAGQLASRVKDTTAASEEMNSSFTRPLENVGVHIFGHELLSSMGIAQGARPILQVLRVGIMEVGESFGAAATAALPFVFGLGALAAIIYKVAEAQKVQAAATAETVAANAQSIESHQQTLEQLNAYKLAIGTLTPELEKLRKETEDLTAAELRNNVQKAGQALKTAADAIKANEEQAKSLEKMRDEAKANQESEHNDLALKAAYAETVFATTEKLKKLAEAHVDLKKAVLEAEGATVAARNGYGTLSAMLTDTTAAMNKHAEASRALGNANEELKAKTAGLFDQIGGGTLASMQKVVAGEEWMAERTKELEASLVEDTRSAWAKKDAAITQFQMKEREAVQKHYQELVLAAKNAGVQITAYEQQKAQAIQAIDNVVAQKRKQNLDVWGEESKKASDAFASGFAGACARSIVEGKNLEDELKNAFKSIAEQVVADLIRIEIQAAITAAAVRSVKAAAVL